MKSMQTKILTKKEYDKLKILPYKHFTDISVQLLKDTPMSAITPFILHIAAEWSLPLYRKNECLYWKGNAFKTATRILENSIRYN